MTPGHQVALMHLLREKARIKLHQLKQLVYEKEIKHPPSLALLSSFAIMIRVCNHHYLYPQLLETRPMPRHVTTNEEKIKWALSLACVLPEAEPLLARRILPDLCNYQSESFSPSTLFTISFSFNFEPVDFTRQIRLYQHEFPILASSCYTTIQEKCTLSEMYTANLNLVMVKSYMSFPCRPSLKHLKSWYQILRNYHVDRVVQHFFCPFESTTLNQNPTSVSLKVSERPTMTLLWTSCENVLLALFNFLSANLDAQ